MSMYGNIYEEELYEKVRDAIEYYNISPARILQIVSDAFDCAESTRIASERAKMEKEYGEYKKKYEAIMRVIGDKK